MTEAGMTDEERRAGAREAAMGDREAALRSGEWLLTFQASCVKPCPEAVKVTVGAEPCWGVWFHDFGKLLDLMVLHEAARKLAVLHVPTGTSFSIAPVRANELRNVQEGWSQATESIRPVPATLAVDEQERAMIHAVDVQVRASACDRSALVRLATMLMVMRGQAIPPDTQVSTPRDVRSTAGLEFRGPWIMPPGCSGVVLDDGPPPAPARRDPRAASGAGGAGGDGGPYTYLPPSWPEDSTLVGGGSGGVGRSSSEDEAPF